jgi:hypothetical protein
MEWIVALIALAATVGFILWWIPTLDAKSRL